MDHQWFWRTDGETYGPLSTDELEDLVRRGRIRGSDQIRLEGSDKWLPADEVRGMFLSPDEGSPVESAAQSAARVLAGASRQALEHEAERPSFSAKLASLIGKSARGPAGLLALFFDLLWSGLDRLKGLFGRKITLGVIALLLLAILFKNLEFGDTQSRDAHEQIAEAWEEMQAMKNRHASPQEWAEFERETLAWLEPTLESLGESAVQNETGIHPTALWSNSHLTAALTQKSLIASGGILKEVLADARRPKAEAAPARKIVTDRNGKLVPPLPQRQITLPPESRFADQMNVAQAFLNGELRSRGQAATTAATPMDPLMAGMVVVDVGIVAGALAFWWRRRRRLRRAAWRAPIRRELAPAVRG